VTATGVRERPEEARTERGGPILKLDGVKKHFPITRGIIFQRKVGDVHAVDGIDLEVQVGETVGLVGETGCGKSTTARLITKLLDPTDGRIEFEGHDITGPRHIDRPVWMSYLTGGLIVAVIALLVIGIIAGWPDAVLTMFLGGLFALGLVLLATIVIGAINSVRRRVFNNRIRGLRRDFQMIFQDPYASLNPRKTVGSIIGDPFRIHKTLPKDKIKPEVQRLMELVGLNPEHYNRFPHEFSGGQRQRIGVARSLALRPRLIVCDEPVSALDVSIQAQILNLLEDLQEEFNLTYIFIAHDLSVVKHMSDRVAVMYLGRIVEIAPGDTLYLNPKHPYTGALLSAVPIPDPNLAAQRQRVILEGDVPSPIDPPSGCRFHPRCPRAQFPVCKEDDPALTPHHEGQLAACHFPLEDRTVVESSA
jgi:oligopeptide/dipeptide ABC transporter ATP-binding protein